MRALPVYLYTYLPFYLPIKKIIRWQLIIWDLLRHGIRRIRSFYASRASLTGGDAVVA